MRLYQAAARANGGEPDAGRRLLGWAHAAGLRDVLATSSTWCFATRRDLDRLARAWTTWAAREDAWFSVLHGEILCRVP